MEKRPLILASQSPRRKELLALITADFEIQAANIDEKAIEKQVMSERTTEPFLTKATRLVETLAAEKAKHILAQYPKNLVIGTDTMVVHEEQTLGKPEDAEEAYRMLRSYAGKTHQVITGVAIVQSHQTEIFSVTTNVSFWEWSPHMDEQMQAYVATGSPQDKAGAYGIQEMPSLWIKKIEGDYPNVVGLPVSYLNQALQKFQ